MFKKKVTLTLSKATAECIGAKASKEMRLFAAAGKLPVKVAEQVAALYYLANDKDPDVKKEARKSLLLISEEDLKTIVSSEQTHPGIVHYFSLLHADRPEILALILQNDITESRTIERMAETGREELLELLAENRNSRWDRAGLIEALKRNPAASDDVMDRIIGKEQNEPLEDAVENEALSEEAPEEVSDELAARLTEEREEDDKEESHSVYKEILTMGVSQKIKFAITGNKEARSILVKDPNRLVCSNVMKNPRLTESEVLLFSASKNVSEEVFRMIEKNRDWLKSYQIKLNLVSNARVPLPIAMKFISHIRDKDLEILAKSRNVPRAISNMARQLILAKKKK